MPRSSRRSKKVRAGKCKSKKKQSTGAESLLHRGPPLTAEQAGYLLKDSTRNKKDQSALARAQRRVFQFSCFNPVFRDQSIETSGGYVGELTDTSSISNYDRRHQPGWKLRRT